MQGQSHTTILAAAAGEFRHGLHIHRAALVDVVAGRVHPVVGIRLVAHIVGEAGENDLRIRLVHIVPPAEVAGHHDLVHTDRGTVRRGCIGFVEGRIGCFRPRRVDLVSHKKEVVRVDLVEGIDLGLRRGPAQIGRVTGVLHNLAEVEDTDCVFRLRRKEETGRHRMDCAGENYTGHGPGFHGRRENYTGLELGFHARRENCIALEPGFLHTGQLLSLELGCHSWVCRGPLADMQMAVLAQCMYLLLRRDCSRNR